MANSLLIQFCFVTGVLIFHPGVSALECYSCNNQSSVGSPFCFNETQEVTECPEPNSVCYTELKYNNRSSGQQPRRFGHRYLDDCDENERRQNLCFNGGLCLVIELYEGEKILLCGCLSGWEGRRCELEEIEDPLADLAPDRSDDSHTSPAGSEFRPTGRINEHSVRMLSNACRPREIQTTRCRHGHCFAMFSDGGVRRPFCNCNVGWTGERCEMRYTSSRIDIRENLRIVTRGCGPETLQSGCRPIDPSSDLGSVDTVCVEVCHTDACNSVPI